jgi:hypothetical protein
MKLPGLPLQDGDVPVKHPSQEEVVEGYGCVAEYNFTITLG